MIVKLWIAAACAVFACGCAHATAPLPTIEFTENSSTGIIRDGLGELRYIIHGHAVEQDEFRRWLKMQTPKAQTPFCPFFPEFCGRPI